MLYLLVVSAALAISKDDLCPVCGQRLGVRVYLFTKRGRDEKVPVCAACSRLETTCYSCGVPVRDKCTRLAGGRLLCEENARTAVLTRDEAEKIFDDVRSDLHSVRANLGSSPLHNIRF